MIKVVTLDGEWQNIEMFENSSHWSQIPNKDMGSCFTLTIPKVLKEKQIQKIVIYLVKKADIFVFLHSQGILNPLAPYLTIERSMIRMTHEPTFYFDMDFIQRKVLDFDGQNCQKSNKTFTKCVQETTRLTSLDQLNCTTPFHSGLFYTHLANF